MIRRVQADEHMRDIVLTTEEEGVALATGAWLGGERAVLLMQSSGVGNCINMFSLLQSCRIPFLTLVTMRGEYAEFNNWQCPMGEATPAALELMGFDTGIDLSKLIGAAKCLPELIGHDIPSQIVKAGQRLDLHPAP